jgi:2-polyprenyl-6-methoxyphenol hydroxylase-like FAD-dependent oxidoreductase
MSNIDVLIVGAGPTGLALALSLEKAGVNFRIIDKADAPGAASRAIAVQARTLEMYDQYGFAQEVVAAGLKLDKPTIWTHGERRVAINFGEFGRGLSPYPFLLMYPQDDHERLLISHLKTKVERPVALERFTQDERFVRAQLSNGETVQARYICGCDGAHSAVRTGIGARFPGGTYEDVFYVADVDADVIEHKDEFYFFLRDRGFLLVLPLPGGRRFRLIGIVPQEIKKDTKDVLFEDIRDTALAETPLRVSAVHWFSTYHVHHRVSDKFREGRAFLLGDAAHIHSPAGGQGMNTGINDAFNLGWKLAHALRTGSDAILESYVSERRAFAQKLVATTDRLFMAVVSRSVFSRFVRLWGFPHLLPRLMSLPFFRRFAFRTISQLIVQYRGLPLSAGHAGKIAGGDRLPWTGQNFAPLQSCAWQIHVYGTAHPDLVAFAQLHALPVVVFAWGDEALRAGFALGAIYLVRPDGYVGFAGFHTTNLRAYCEKWAVLRR